MSRTRKFILVGVLLFSFIASTFSFLKRPDVVLFWRKVRHYPNSLVRPYRAPVINCDYKDSWNDGTYWVFLHQGCSFEKHTQTVAEQVLLDPKITHRFPETPRHGAYYRAKEIDDAALEAIQADIVVDLLECEQGVIQMADDDWEAVPIYDLLRAPPGRHE